MGSLRWILFVLDETLHLCGHMSYRLSRNLADNEVWITVVAHNLSIIVVGSVLTAAPRALGPQHIWRKFCVITHNQHINQIVVSIIIVIGNIILDRGAGSTDRFQRNQFCLVSGFRLPLHVGLHGSAELIRGNNQHVSLVR